MPQYRERLLIKRRLFGLRMSFSEPPPPPSPCPSLSAKVRVEVVISGLTEVGAYVGCAVVGIFMWPQQQ